MNERRNAAGTERVYVERALKNITLFRKTSRRGKPTAGARKKKRTKKRTEPKKRVSSTPLLFASLQVVTQVNNAEIGIIAEYWNENGLHFALIYLEIKYTPFSRNRNDNIEKIGEFG